MTLLSGFQIGGGQKIAAIVKTCQDADGRITQETGGIEHEMDRDHSGSSASYRWVLSCYNKGRRARNAAGARGGSTNPFNGAGTEEVAAVSTRNVPPRASLSLLILLPPKAMP
jgi:hypothetical protein